jgi:hypothetical protein
VAAALGAFAAPALGAPVSPDEALQPFQDFLRGLVGWLLGPGRLIIALAWLAIGFKTVLGMERTGAGGFVFVALVGFAIVFAPQILGALGIDVSSYLGP